MLDIVPALRRSICVSVVGLIVFLAGSSQHLFGQIAPCPLSPRETLVFNTLVLLLLLCYYRACVTSPGSPSRVRAQSSHLDKGTRPVKRRWCRKCDHVKLPRWHHCRSCGGDQGTCVPKMDHHCIWIRNCVSHTTFPHFWRFLLYSVAAMLHLEYLLTVRLGALWTRRKLPSHLGPSRFQMCHLLVLTIVNSLTLFSLSVLLFSSSRGLLLNETTIEGWEKDRHRVLLRRARAMGGYVLGPGGIKVWITKQEFPYDIGFLQNIIQGMGTSNVLAWFWPFSATPPIDTALSFETNGFEDEGMTWPPPDPDRIPVYYQSETHAHDTSSQSSSDHADASRSVADSQRQAKHGQRLAPTTNQLQKRRPFHESAGGPPAVHDGNVVEGEEGWRNSQGDRLADYGLDAEVEFYDETEPLRSEGEALVSCMASASHSDLKL